MQQRVSSSLVVLILLLAVTIGTGAWFKDGSAGLVVGVIASVVLGVIMHRIAGPFVEDGRVDLSDLVSFFVLSTILVIFLHVVYFWEDLTLLRVLGSSLAMTFLMLLAAVLRLKLDRP